MRNNLSLIVFGIGTFLPSEGSLQIHGKPPLQEVTTQTQTETCACALNVRLSCQKIHQDLGQQRPRSQT